MSRQGNTAGIICPEATQGMKSLSRHIPLALLPVGGKSLLDWSLEELKEKGYKHIEVFVSDRPEAIRAAVHDGSKWGLTISIRPTTHQYTASEIVNHSAASNNDSGLSPDDIFTVDHLPLSSNRPLFENLQNCFQRVINYLPTAAHQRHIVRQSPGVWISSRAQVSPSARLHGPCWIGDDALINDNAEIGPDTVIGDHSLVDENASVTRCYVGPRTYVGIQTKLDRSFVWGNQLVNWASGNQKHVSDRLALASLTGEQSTDERYRPTRKERYLALTALIAMSPLLLILIIWLKLTKGKAIVPAVAVCPRDLENVGQHSSFTYFELNTSIKRACRLPRLWSIWRGHMAWCGNPPLSPQMAVQLETEFDQLWLAAPIGLASLGDCYDCIEPHNDEARAHATFFAVQSDANTCSKILLWLWTGK